LYINSIGKKVINNGGNNNENNKSSAGLVKKIKRKEKKNVTPYFEIVLEFVIQGNKNCKEEDKETIIEQQRVVFIINKLMKKSVYVE
jgi:hypothetical protein